MSSTQLSLILDTGLPPKPFELHPEVDQAIRCGLHIRSSPCSTDRASFLSWLARTLSDFPQQLSSLSWTTTASPLNTHAPGLVSSLHSKFDSISSNHTGCEALHWHEEHGYTCQNPQIYPVRAPKFQIGVFQEIHLRTEVYILNISKISTETISRPHSPYSRNSPSLSCRVKIWLVWPGPALTRQVSRKLFAEDATASAVFLMQPCVQRWASGFTHVRLDHIASSMDTELTRSRPQTGRKVPRAGRPGEGAQVRSVQGRSLVSQSAISLFPTLYPGHPRQLVPLHVKHMPFRPRGHAVDSTRPSSRPYATLPRTPNSKLFHNSQVPPQPDTDKNR